MGTLIYTAGYVTNQTNQLVEVEIHDRDYDGSASVLSGTGSGWLSYSHQRLNPRNYQEIQSGEVSVSVHIQTGAHETFRHNLLNSPEGRYTLKLYFDSVLEWEGDILPDLCSYTESFDEVLTIVAKDFSLLRKDLFPLEDLRQTISTTIARILPGFDIIYATSWQESNVGADFVQNIYHETKALRTFRDEGDIQINNETALKWILRNYGFTLRQS